MQGSSKIPAVHTVVPENEKADIIAKQAIGWRGTGQIGQRAPPSKMGIATALFMQEKCQRDNLRMWAVT